MSALRLVSRRWGQWLCFSYGGLAVTWGLAAHNLAGVIGAGALLLTGVGLRAIAVWREAR